MMAKVPFPYHAHNRATAQAQTATQQSSFGRFCAIVDCIEALGFSEPDSLAIAMGNNSRVQWCSAVLVDVQDSYHFWHDLYWDWVIATPWEPAPEALLQ